MRNRIFSLGVLIAVLATGCAETRYVPYKVSGGKELDVFSRTVAYEIDRALYVDMPDCVLIMSPEANDSQTPYARLVESELSRYLKEKFSRVIGPVERRVASRALVVNVSSLEDRRVLAEKLNCEAFVFTKLLDPGPTNLILWSQVSIDMDVRVERATDGRILWRARTKASRSEGGLPLNPISILTNGFSSLRLTADEADVGASIVSDAVRRLTQTLPDARSFADAKQKVLP